MAIVARVWNLGITHTDDAWWALWACEVSGNIFVKRPIANWAIEQGRLWAFVSGAFILGVLRLQGTIWGELLRAGGFVGFWASFHATVHAYCGRRTAILASTLVTGWFVVRWDGSILTTYPLITWVAGVAFCGALICAKRYVLGGGRGRIYAASALLLFSFFNNEGVTVTFAFLAFGAAAVLKRHAPDDESRSRARTLLISFLGVAIVYALAAIAFQRMHPTTYEGHKLAWDIRAALRALSHFSLGSTVLHDIVSPYRVTYADHQWAIGDAKVYRLGVSLKELPYSLPAVAALAASSWLAFSTLCSTRPEDRAVCRTLPTVAGGFALAVLLVLPVSLTGRYQSWVVQNGIQAYSHSALAHFGWCLAFAAILLWAADRITADHRKRWAAVIAAAIGLLSGLAFVTSDRIVDDMRAESGRWRALRYFLEMNSEGPHAPAIFLPELGNGSWYTAVYEEYWTWYARSRYGDTTQIFPKLSAQRPLPPASWIGSYAVDSGGKFAGLMAPLEPSAPGAAAIPVFLFREGRCESAWKGWSIVNSQGQRVTLANAVVAQRDAICVATLPLPNAEQLTLVRDSGRAHSSIDVNRRRTHTHARAE